MQPATTGHDLENPGINWDLQIKPTFLNQRFARCRISALLLRNPPNWLKRRESASRRTRRGRCRLVLLVGPVLDLGAVHIQNDMLVDLQTIEATGTAERDRTVAMLDETSLLSCSSAFFGLM